MPRLIPGQTLPVPELSQATYTPYSELGEWLEGPPPAPNLMKTAYPQLRAEDLASPEFYQATRPINEMEMLGGLAQTVDYFTGAPVRAGLGEMLKPGDSPMGGLGAFIKQFSKHPSEAPTGKDLAGGLGFSTMGFKEAAGLAGQDPDFYPDWSPAGIVGYGIEAVADMTPLVAMTLPGGRMFHGSPHYWKKADISKVGTGEGAQAFGHGLYVTDAPEIAEDYARSIKKAPFVNDIAEKHGFELNAGGRGEFSRLANDGNLEPERAAYFLQNGNIGARSVDKNKLASAISEYRQKKGSPLFYTTEIPKGEYLQWHEAPTADDIKRINDLAEKEITKKYDWKGNKIDLTQEYYKDASGHFFPSDSKKTGGEAIYNNLTQLLGGKKQASEFLNRAGFTGIQYPAGTLSGVSDSKAMNYVLFNDKDLTVKEIKNLSTGKVEKVGGGVKSPVLYQGRSKKGIKELQNPKGEIWGTTNKETAEGFARINETHYPYRNPPETTKEMLGEVHEFNLNMDNPKTISHKKTMWDSKKEAQEIAKAKREGYDGLIIEHDNGKKDYVGFDLKQIYNQKVGDGKI